MNVGTILWIVIIIIICMIIIKDKIKMNKSGIKVKSDSDSDPDPENRISLEKKQQLSEEKTENPAVALNDTDINNRFSETENSLEILSLSLQKGFKILRFIIIILAVFFLFSNIYRVEEGTIAIHARFGKILKKNGTCAVKSGGPYFAFPAPIDTIIKIPTTMQSVSVDKAFWMDNNSESELQIIEKQQNKRDDRPSMSYLAPGIDGSLITGDKNIVQGQWSVNFQLDYNSNLHENNNSPELFIQNVGTMKNAGIIVRNAVEQAIVNVVAQLTVEEFVRGDIDNKLIIKNAMKILDSLNTGIRIVHLSPERYTVPKWLTDDFQAVNRAQSEKASQIETAKRYRSEILNESAGADFQKIIDAISTYEKEFSKMTPIEKMAKEKIISFLLRSREMGGSVSEIINDSIIYKTQTVEFVKGSSNRFEKLFEQYKENPAILRNRLMQDTFQKVFSGNVKTFYLPPDRKKKVQ